MSTTIVHVKARQIIDSRANPTVQVEIGLEDGTYATASVPSGASTGVHEACELRDNDPAVYGGRGVLKAVANVETLIAGELYGRDARDLAAVDRAMIELDGTPNKSRLGANAILGVSLAVCRAAAISLKVPLCQYIGGIYGSTLPTPMMNFINGGVHADNALDIQEFMIVPHGLETFPDKLRAGCECYYALKKLLKSRGHSTNIGDEGGFAPALEHTEAAFDFLTQAIQAAGYTPGKHISLALDVAASELYKDGKYTLEGKSLTADELIARYVSWTEKYPLCSIEDGCAEDDWAGWKTLTEAMGEKIMLVGDDLFVTNQQRLQQGIDAGVANAILIKLNQIGTVTETMETVQHAKTHNYQPVVSHRSGETEDAFLADFAVGVQANWIKCGSVARAERTAKYNRLLQIAEEIPGEEEAEA